MQIFNDDCFNVFPKIKDKTIDLFVLDLPYANFKFGACTACKWDLPIDLEKMWVEIKRIMKPNAVIVFFCNTRFGYALLNSNPKWFKYDLIWKKSKKVGFLNANKQPLRQHENIYVFNNQKATYNPQKEKGKPYKHKGTGEATLYKKKRIDIVNTTGDRHPSSILPDMDIEEHENLYIFNKEKPTYNPQKTEGKPYTMTRQNADLYDENVKNIPTVNKGDRHPTSILPNMELEEHENLYVFNKEKPTYNPQKTEGKPYINNRKQKKSELYGRKLIETTDNKGDRHPTSILPDDLKSTILEYNNPHKTIHRTQKPEKLLEWLIKTYSNEGDTVMDFCMGSGTAGVACINTNRKFIGVEKDPEIFKLAKKRIEEKNKTK